ncbi:MAG: hypothetical protein P8Y67_05965 [Alphaproteobacteria bacterium]
MKSLSLNALRIPNAEKPSKKDIKRLRKRFGKGGAKPSGRLGRDGAKPSGRPGRGGAKHAAQANQPKEKRKNTGDALESMARSIERNVDIRILT